MYNVEPRSHKYKAEKAAEESSETIIKDSKPAVTKGRTKKKSGLANIGKSIISEDAKNVKSYIMMDVLIPAFQKAVSDIVTNGIDIILYGEAGRTKRKSRDGGRVSYSGYYDKDRSSSRRYRDDEDRGRRSSSIFDDVIVDSKAEGEEVLNRMDEILDQYPTVSVADLYEAAEIKQYPHTANNYGWKSVSEGKTVKVSDGWLIKLPTPISIR